MKTRVVVRSLLLGFALAAMSSASFAGAILSATGITQNTMGVFNTIDANSIDYVSDGSGLPAFISGVTDFATYMGANPAHANFANGNAWSSNGNSLTGIIDFDLGDVYSIAQLALWNQGNTQGINRFQIYTATEATFAAANLVGSFGATSVNTLGQVFDVTNSIGRFVRLEVLSNHGASCCTTLGEIAFDVNAAVPEPTSVALMLLGALGIRQARRRN